MTAETRVRGANEKKRIEAEKALRRAALNYAGANARYAAEWRRQYGDGLSYKHDGPIDELTDIACTESNVASEALHAAAKALYAALAAKEEEKSPEDHAEMLADLPL